MEKITKKVKDSVKHILAKEMGIFDWKVVKEDRIETDYVELTFERDNETSYYQELTKLENEYFSLKTPSVIPLVILALAGFTLLTLFVMFGFLFEGYMTFTVAVLSFLVPGIICIATLGVLGALTTRKSLNIANNHDDRVKMFGKKVDELKNGK